MCYVYCVLNVVVVNKNWIAQHTRPKGSPIEWAGPLPLCANNLRDLVSFLICYKIS